MAYDYPGMYRGDEYKPPQKNDGWGQYNQGNPYGQGAYKQVTGPGMGISNGGAANTGPMVRSGPATGFTATNFDNADIATPMPGFGRTINTQTGDAFSGGNKIGNVNGNYGNTNISTPTPGFNAPMPMFNAPATQPGFQGPGFETQYGTLPNIDAYMTPYLDQIIGRGNKNILATASARGHLGSSGVEQELGGWAAEATANEYQNAFNRFTGDRNYMTDVYQDGRNFDYRNMRDTDAWNYGMYGDEKADWNTRMQDWYNQMNGISNTGVNAAGNAGNIQGDLGRALAVLYGNRGDVGANQAANQGGMNAGLIDALLSAIIGKGG